MPAVIVAMVSALSGCFEEIKEPTCSDLRNNDVEMLKKQGDKFPELMRNLQDKCPNQGTGGFRSSTATKGLIR
ncbi:hypothetical protein [Pseudomonas sp. NPDC089401]|uniref:hypothetical protein n=1 Tax=Pseudomonas sp. NPDC089401 TaxID=3364462 RepID=UPI0037F4DFFB